MSENLIEHNGKIVNVVDGGLAQVVIDAKSACAGCHAKSACGLADLKKKVIDVNVGDGDYKKGDEVTVVLKQKMGFVAVFYAYVLPLILIVLSLAMSNIFSKGDVFAGMLAIVVFIVYYILLYLCRNRLSKYFVFELKK